MTDITIALADHHDRADLIALLAAQLHEHQTAGSDVHVMLALHHRSRQVVVTHEIRDDSDMVGERLGT
jgi:hypothetical protein